MKIVVIGAGAMGTLYGGRLALAGEEVTMVDVVEKAVRHMDAEGLTLELADGVHTAKVSARLAAEMDFAADLVILFTKSVYSRAALESAKTFIGPDTVVMTLQNGLGNLELVNEYLPRERIIVGISDFPSDLIETGHIRSIGEGHTRIMTASGEETDFLRKVRDSFEAAGLHCSITPDIMATIWTKVAVNATANSITSVCRLRCGVLISTPEAWQLALRILDEVVAVATADGVKLDREAIVDNVHKVMEAMPGHLTSMEQDVLAKRPTEVGSINGGVVKKAKALGLDAPCNETMYLLIRTIEQNYQDQIL